jgi:hypothetical protein
LNSVLLLDSSCLPPDRTHIETANIRAFQEKRRRLNAFMPPSYHQVETRNSVAISQQRSARNDMELTNILYERAILNEREQAVNISNHLMAREQNGEDGFQHILLAQGNFLPHRSQIYYEERERQNDIDIDRNHKLASTVRTQQPKAKKTSDLAIEYQEKWNDRFQRPVEPYKETFEAEEERAVLHQQSRKEINLLNNDRSTFAMRTQTRAIRTRAIRSGPTRKNRDEKWDDRFQHLVAYKEKFGHCKVPAKVKEYKSLRNWLGKQREAYKIYKTRDSAAEGGGGGLLNAERFNKLESIGVSLDPFSTNWNSRFQELVLFQSRYGHCKVPQQGNSSHTRLGQWLGRQKKDLRPVRDMERGNISFSARDLERGRLLESVGVRLDE